MKGALRENKAVKSTVDDIANGARKNKRHAQYQPCFFLAFNGQPEQNADTGNGDQPKNAQGQFSPAAAQLHAKGHAIVFGKQKVKPMVENRNVSPQRHGEFYVKLQCLVEHQHQ